MFTDLIALQTTLEKDGTGAFGLASPSCSSPHSSSPWFGGSAGQAPTWLACTWPRCLQTPSRASPRASPRHREGATLQGRAPFARLARAPAFHPRTRLLVAIVAKGRAVMGWRSLLARSGLLVLHLNNIQARGLGQGCPW